LIGERKRDETNEAKKNSWPFMASWFIILFFCSFEL
jgi:hypothetical protein